MNKSYLRKLEKHYNEIIMLNKVSNEEIVKCLIKEILLDVLENNVSAELLFNN